MEALILFLLLGAVSPVVLEISSVEQFPVAETIDKLDEDLQRRNHSHHVSVSAFGSASPARSIQFWDLLPLEMDVEQETIQLPRIAHLDSLQMMTSFEKTPVKAVGIQNILVQASKKKRLPRTLDSEEPMPSFCESSKVCQKVSSKLKKKTSRNKRAADFCPYEVTIEAFTFNYTLCIFLQHLSKEPIVGQTYSYLNVTVFNKDNSTADILIDSLNLHFATGYIVGEEHGSVSGYVLDDHFYGTVYLKDSVHYLEPHGRKSKDMQIFGDGLMTLLHRRPKNLPNILTSRLHSGKKNPSRKLCDLTIVADHLFFKEIGEGSLTKTVLQMLWHIKEANSIFQAKDFDDDGTSECIGFTVAEISIFQSEESQVNLLTGNFSIPEDFLKRFSRYNFDGFCLGVLFTNRAFSELVLGLSWRGNPKPEGVGGICQSRVMIKSDRNAYSFNALFISLKSIQEERIPLRMGVLNLVHELMHSFGAKHDPERALRPDCTPEDKWVNGRYLMSKYSNDGHKLNHMILSPCTKALIRTNLESPTRVGCLKIIQESFCGDMIVQENEECDCGSILQCLAARSCCVPPEGIGKLKPCTYHREIENCARDMTVEELD